jgi:hypothetical protein
MLINKKVIAAFLALGVTFGAVWVIVAHHPPHHVDTSTTPEDSISKALRAI